MAFSFVMGGGAGADTGFAITAVASILRDLALMGLVFFFLWRNGEPLTHVGWDLRSWGREAGLGALLFIPFIIGVGLVQSFLQRLGFTVIEQPPPGLTVGGGGEIFLALVLLVVVAVSEETIFRGYLISRFGALTKSAAAAVLLASLVFSLGHGYQGSAGVVTVALVGMAFGTVYVWRRNIVAVTVMHFLLNFMSIIVLPFAR